MSLLIRRWKEAEKLAKKNNKTPSFREPRVAILEGLLFKFWEPGPKTEAPTNPARSFCTGMGPTVA